MQKWRESYGPVAGLLILLWLILEGVRSIMLLPSDLREMGEMVVSLGELKVPAWLVRWCLEAALIVLVAVLIAPGLHSVLRLTFNGLRRWAKTTRDITKLFKIAEREEIALLHEALGGPKWLDLDGKYSRVLFDFCVKVRSQRGGYGTKREGLCEIRSYRWLIRLLIWRRERLLARHRRERVLQAVRNLTKKERRFLWLFWYQTLTDPLKLFDMETLEALDRNDIVKWQTRTYYQGRVRLSDDAVALIEKYVLKGKKIKRREFTYGIGGG